MTYAISKFKVTNKVNEEQEAYLTKFIKENFKQKYAQILEKVQVAGCSPPSPLFFTKNDVNRLQILKNKLIQDGVF